AKPIARMKRALASTCSRRCDSPGLVGTRNQHRSPFRRDIKPKFKESPPTIQRTGRVSNPTWHTHDRPELQQAKRSRFDSAINYRKVNRKLRYRRKCRPHSPSEARSSSAVGRLYLYTRRCHWVKYVKR